MVLSPPAVLWLVFCFFLVCFVCVVAFFFFFLISLVSWFFFFLFPEQGIGKILNSTTDHWSAGLLRMTLFSLC